MKEIYGMRWSIEIFFREIKSYLKYLKIERFIGKNLNLDPDLFCSYGISPDRITQNVL